MEKEKRAFYDYLILVTIVMAGLFGMEGLLRRYVADPDWNAGILGIFFFIHLGWVAVYQAIVYRRPEEKALQNYVDEWLVISIVLMALLSIAVYDKAHFGPKTWLFVPLVILLQAYGLYRNDRTAKEALEKEETQKREPEELLRRVSQSDRPVFIVVSHNSKQDIQFELDDRTLLYLLPDGRYLVLFRKKVGIEEFQNVLSALRTEVNADEDVIGYYGLPHKGNHPDEPLAFVSNLPGECRVIPFDPKTVPFADADLVTW